MGSINGRGEYNSSSSSDVCRLNRSDMGHGVGPWRPRPDKALHRMAAGALLSGRRCTLIVRRPHEKATVKISVFIGTSVDGFIARANGDLDFLPPGGGEPHGYDEFMATVDALVGWATG
jgi:hypothetical protein